MEVDQELQRIMKRKMEEEEVPVVVVFKCFLIDRRTFLPQGVRCQS